MYAQKERQARMKPMSNNPTHFAKDRGRSQPDENKTHEYATIADKNGTVKIFISDSKNDDCEKRLPR